MTKLCTKRGKEKDETLFGRDKNRKDGLKCWCKLCMNKYNNLWYDNAGKTNGHILISKSPYRGE